ncbi:MAG: SDR family oxidoreductase [Actinobacteria bacterium]|nr:SDR family oxidoreductase [Actinomycetota bacterium]
MAEGNRFGGRTAIVTGAASGIGRATAQRLAADGAAVACLDMSDAAQATVDLITETGGTAMAVAVDVSDVDSVRSAVAAVEAELGPARVLANIAGVLRFANAHEMPVDQWDLVIDVNLKGTFLMCQAVIPSMLANGGGAIVNVASSAGMFGQAYVAAYGASKGGVAIMTRALAWEYLKRDIRVNAIAPGGVETPMTSKVDFPADMDFTLIEKTIAVGNKMMDPAEPAGLISYLASDEASSINGAVIPIDNGITA